MMEISELKKQMESLIEIHKTNIHRLISQYVKENAKFKEGDIIQNTTGIIRIDKITYEMLFELPVIMYEGISLWPKNGELLPTKGIKRKKLIGELCNLYTR